MTGDQQSACIIVGIIFSAVVLIVLIVAVVNIMEANYSAQRKCGNKDKKPLI